MTALTQIEQVDPVEERIELSLVGLSPHSARVYSARLRAMRLFLERRGYQFNRVGVLRFLEAVKLKSSAVVHNQALAAAKRLARSMMESGVATHEWYGTIQSLRALKVTGVRTGKWLTLAQLRELLAEPLKASTIEMRLRDRAILALLAGAGLRRAELCALLPSQLRSTEGALMVSNVLGKGGRIRTIAIPRWASDILAKWMERVQERVQGPNDLPLFRAFGKATKRDSKAGSSEIVERGMSASTIRKLVRHYGQQIGVRDLAPHDLRRTYARLARKGGAQLETIQRSLGHASVQTTEKYIQTGEEANAGDYINL